MKPIRLTAVAAATLLTFAALGPAGAADPSAAPSGAAANPASPAAPGKPQGYAIGRSNTAGWSMMTAEERKAHREKMHGAQSFEECKAYQAEHHAHMEARAKEQGKTLRAPRANACERMKARGGFK